MSDVILTNWTVYYAGDTGGDQQVRWTGTTGTNTVNELYSAIQDLFDETGQLDDSLPISGQTPSDYTMGEIEAGEINAWFIDPESIKHLTGGGILTNNWARVVDTNIGIFRIATNGAAIVPADVGFAITHADGDAGTLLHVDEAVNELWVRPDSSAVGNDFSTSSGNLTANGNVDIQSAAATTGEMIWTNVFILGTLSDDTRVYIAQNDVEIDNSILAGTNNLWWVDGNMDTLILTTDQGTLTDFGNLSLYARQFTQEFDHTVVDASAGGRIPVVLNTKDDINNDSGVRTLNVDGAPGGVFTPGELISIVGGAPATAKGVVTQNIGSPTTSIQYYVVGDGTTDFINNDDLTGDIVGDNGDVNGAPANITNGVADTAGHGITIGFAGPYSVDVNGQGATDYSIQINANSQPLLLVYEFLKYSTSRGVTTALNGIEGQQYIGIDTRIEYGTAADTDFVIGDRIRQAGTSVATGIVTNFNNAGSPNYLMVRDTTGIWGTDTDISNDNGTGSILLAQVNVVETITPIKISPFGTFAGGNFFGARSVVIINEQATESNNYEVIDDAGVTKSEPITISVHVNDNNGANLQNCRVFLEASDGTGDFPFEESVTITRVTTTASVAHIDHGMFNGDVVVIRGAIQPEYNGPHTISNVTTNAYDYTVAGSPTSPATGTIISSGAIINALTNAGGDASTSRAFTLATPVKGRARKSTASPRFKTTPLSGTVSASLGLALSVQLIIDE